MNNLTFRRLFFLLLVLAWPSIFFANSLNTKSLPHVFVNDTCPAPAPAWLIFTNITPHSISLAWEANMIGLYYRVEGDDITAGTPLPTKYCMTPYITYDSLPSGHEFEFRVSASHCEGGAWGPDISRTGRTIIIDFIVDLKEPCTPNSDYFATGNGANYELCVGHSTEPAPPPYNNGFVGKIQLYGLIPVYFGLAATQEVLRIGEVGDDNSFVYFQSILNQNDDVIGAYCKTNTNVNIFKIDNVSIGTQPGVTGFKITFYGSYGNFYYCNFPCGNEHFIDGGESVITSKNTVETSFIASYDVIQPLLNPNPFTQSTTFRYTLQEPGPVDISLYDAMGRLVKVVQKTTLQEAGNYETTVDGAGLPDGVYFLHTMTGQNRQVFSLVKQE